MHSRWACISSLPLRVTNSNAGFYAWAIYIHLNHRMVRLEGTSGGHLVQLPCSNRATCIQLPRILSRQFLSISKEVDSTNFLVNLCQWSLILVGKNCFLMFRWNLLCFSLCPLLSVLSWHHWKKHGSIQLYTFPLYILVRYALNLIFSRLNSPNSLNLSLYSGPPVPSSSLGPCSGLSPEKDFQESLINRREYFQMC